MHPMADAWGSGYLRMFTRAAGTAYRLIADLPEMPRCKTLLATPLHYVGSEGTVRQPLVAPLVSCGRRPARDRHIAVHPRRRIGEGNAGGLVVIASTRQYDDLDV